MRQIKPYTETLYYQIKLTARYFKLLGVQMFEKIKAEVSFEEFIALDLIMKNSGMCQRDLAKLLVKDRANTGRIADSLEQKNLINIETAKKNNRTVKSLVVTKKGRECIKNILEKLEPFLSILNEMISPEEESRLSNELQKFRNEVGKIVEIQI